MRDAKALSAAAAAQFTHSHTIQQKMMLLFWLNVRQWEEKVID